MPTSIPPHPGALLLRWALCLIALAPTGSHAASGVGFATIEARDPVGTGALPGMVFYPSEVAPGTTVIGAYTVAANAGAPPTPGAKPLIVISHGHGGSMLGHHDLATALAREGYVVTTLEHPKDNYRDTTGAGTPEVLAGRPRQVSAMISHLLAQPRWKALIDPSRIGVAGFSAGGYTSLLLVGAVPAFERINGYCERHPDDPEMCWFARLSADERTQSLADLHAGLTRWGATADPRVRAAFVMAPLSLFFDGQGLATTTRPVFLYYAQDDHVLLPDENALHIRPLLKNLVDAKAVADADHWVFMAPCTAALAARVKDICNDPPGVDRAKAHAQIDADALAFFARTLAPKSR